MLTKKRRGYETGRSRENEGEDLIEKKHIISLSGGKDSTAMLLRMVELQMPIDEIRYFDCGSWEFPQMKTHIDKIENYINMPIIRMKYKYDFDYLFSEKITKKGFVGYGFPSMNYRWCTGKKMDTLARGLKRKDCLFYLGIASDEIHRAKEYSMRKIKAIHPLIEWEWTEKDCLTYCYSKGFNWDGLYKYFGRVSCWCCPLQSIPGLRNLRKYFPELWLKLLNMQNEMLTKKKRGYSICDMAISFKMDGTTVFDLERRFKEEEKQISLVFS